MVSEAKEMKDSLLLDEVTVTARRRIMPRIGADGTLTLTDAALTAVPRMFGEADLIRVMLSSSGVSTISDYAAGATIDGMDYSQNSYLLNGIPVQFPYHFGGIFSTFNPAHYPKLTLHKTVKTADMPEVLGGVIETYGHDNPPQRTCGSANAGMMASSLTLKFPVTERFSIEASGRVSYIDALYHNLLASRSTDVRYNLYDADLTARYLLSPSATLTVFAHHNGDRLSYSDENYAMDTRLRWHNSLAGIDYRGRHVRVTAGWTSMDNRLHMSMPGFSISMPSGISQFIVKGSADFTIRGHGFTAGAEADESVARPQSVSLNGFGNSDAATNHRQPHQNAFAAKLWAYSRFTISEKLYLTAGLKLNSYFGPGKYRTFNADPQLTATLSLGATTLTAHAGRYHQYIHQIGFSEIGMASNFRLPASATVPVQQSLTFSLSGNRFLYKPSLAVTAEAYYKRVLAQPEYFGGVIDLLNSDYRAETFISSCSGYNAGINLTATRDFNMLSLSLTYGWSVARRRTAGNPEYFPASSEVPHSINLTGSLAMPGGHWTLNASFGYATGRPVTPVRAIYFIGERLMVEYGRRNSSNLPAYHRLDLGAAYSFATGRINHTVSLSIINAYGHRNIEMSSYAFNVGTGALRLRQVASLYRFLPSLSYSIAF